MCHHLLENFIFRVAAYFEIASGIEVTTFQDFCHGELLLEEIGRYRNARLS
jgi:hypothetical protein